MFLFRFVSATTSDIPAELVFFFLFPMSLAGWTDAKGLFIVYPSPEHAADAKKYLPRYKAWKAVEEVFEIISPHVFGCFVHLFSFVVTVRAGGAGKRSQC